MSGAAARTGSLEKKETKKGKNNKYQRVEVTTIIQSIQGSVREINYSNIEGISKVNYKIEILLYKQRDIYWKLIFFLEREVLQGIAMKVGEINRKMRGFSGKLGGSRKKRKFQRDLGDFHRKVGVLVEK